ncbi:glycosyltransferase family 4 protein [Thiolapillus sp.]
MSTPEFPVGYIVKRYPRYSETFIVNEVLSHERAGADIHIFALRPPNDTHFQDIIARVRAPVHYLPYNKMKLENWLGMITELTGKLPGLRRHLADNLHHGAREILQAAVLAEQVQRHGIRHLHAHFATYPAEVTRLAALFAGVSYSFTAHAVDIFHESVRTEDLREKFSDAAFTVTVSDYNLDYLQQRLGAIPSTVHRIYNGMDLDQFTWKSPLQRPPEIIAIGRLVEKKGFRDLVDACAILRRKGTPFRCRIIGMGDLREALAQQIIHHGLQDVVELSGPMPQNEIRSRIQSAAVFAAPCVVAADGNRDGLPTVLLEAMALGTPCISTDVTGIPEVILHEQTGYQVPQHDPDALASALEILLQDGQKREDLARRARRLIEEHFDVDRNTALIRQQFSLAAAPVSASAEQNLEMV